MRSSISLVVALAFSMPAAAGAQALAADAPPPAVSVPLEVVAPAPVPVEARPVEVRPAEPRGENGAPVSGYGGVGLWVESIDLRGAGFTLGAPEVEALRGVRLDASWAGNAPLARATAGGVGIHVGMRAYDFLRGPELRLMIGGGEVNGPWAPAPGSDRLELSVRSISVLRLETAVGFQIPLGPVVPYVLGRAGVGLAEAELGVRDASLGRLGSERVTAAMFELGIEAGLAFRVLPGLELGAAFRGSFLGQESLGAVVTVGFDGSTFDE